MDPRELDLNEIDALLGEDDIDTLLGADIEEDSDDFDDLLAGDDFDLDDDFGVDDEEDSLEEILGAIDNQYLSEKEQVFLSNKAFLDSKNPTQLDSFFMNFQETLYGAMDDYHNDDEEDLFGAAGGPDSMDDLELEADLMSGSCFGSDEEEDAFLEDAIINGEIDDLDDEFGVAPLLATPIFSKQVRKGVGEAAKNVGKFFDKHGKTVAQTAAAVALAPITGGGSIAALAAGKAIDSRKTKGNYVAKVNALQRCVKRFEKMARKVNSDVAVKLVAGKRAFLRRPFSIMAASSAPDKRVVSAVLSGQPLNLKDRRLVSLAKKCDEKYAKLRSIYRTLKAKGKTAGIVSPDSVFNDIMKNLTLKAQKASKANGGAVKAVAAGSIPAIAIAASKKDGIAVAPKQVQSGKGFKKVLDKATQNVLAIRKANKVAEKKDKLAFRAKVVAAAKQNKQNRLIKRKLAEERKQDVAMVQANPYMDAADMAALDRARAQRMPKKLPVSPRMHVRKPKIGPKVAPVIAPNAGKGAHIVSVEAEIKKLEASLKLHAGHHRKSIEQQQKFAKGSTPYNAQYAKTKKYAEIISNLNAKIKQKKALLADLMTKK